MEEQPQQRIVRLAMPPALIRRVDAVVHAGTGGYQSRSEFILDAIEERLTELTAEGAPAGDSPMNVSVLQSVASPPSHLPLETLEVPGPTGQLDQLGPSEFRIGPTVSGYAIEATDVPAAEPLFGLHNSDLPSLWALARLAEFTVEAPLPAESFYAEVLAAAWVAGSALSLIERNTGSKLTALFPTNAEKRKSAEAAFRSFAVGDYHRTDQGLRTTGPLFEWRAAGLTDTDGTVEIGVTRAGHSLLAATSELTIDKPRAPEVAVRFFEHLMEYSPEDWRAFRELLRAIGGGATRQHVLDHFASMWPDWTANEVSTNAAGYVARAREWGLVAPKQNAGRYQLTSFGETHAD